MDYINKAKEIIRLEGEEVLKLQDAVDGGFSRAVEMCLASLRAGKKILVVGVGKSGNIGKKICATLNSTGATSVFLSSQNALHGDLGLLSAGDCVLALSYSGETAELLDLLPYLKREEVAIIGMTGKSESSLARHSDAVIATPVTREACPLNLAPTSSSTAMLVMGDALAMVLLEAQGFSADDFARYHPGGALGRALLTRVSDIMRGGEELALLTEQVTVMDCLHAMSAKRTGACVLVNAEGKLAGIFTHGDFARCFQRDPQVGQAPVGKYMTKHPITVQAESLAVEAVKTIGRHRVDDVVVLNAQGQVVGLVDTQDFARLKLV